jgi:2-polyprenyl-3-methyl-5-hydroxy-6-metoxy-1,4-benzoquinol methylase
MAIFRTKNEPTVTFYEGKQAAHLFENTKEWINEQQSGVECRADLPSWQDRYVYEAGILSKVVEAEQYTKLIELGSGPGVLGQKIIERTGIEKYTFIDQPGAKDIFESRNYKGNFLVKDMMNDFDISDLDTDYDFLITNDFLEHIYNPSKVVQNCHKIIRPGGKMFVGVPNWRMGHTFIYRGLFDFDNFVYFMLTHGFNLVALYESPLRCPNNPKLSSESDMDDALISSWNWYMLFDKIN